MRLQTGYVWTYGPPPRRLGSSWRGDITKPNKSDATLTTEYRGGSSQEREEWPHTGFRVVAVNGRRV